MLHPALHVHAIDVTRDHAKLTVVAYWPGQKREYLQKALYLRWDDGHQIARGVHELHGHVDHWLGALSVVLF